MKLLQLFILKGTHLCAQKATSERLLSLHCTARRPCLAFVELCSSRQFAQWDWKIQGEHPPPFACKLRCALSVNSTKSLSLLPAHITVCVLESPKTSFSRCIFSNEKRSKPLKGNTGTSTSTQCDASDETSVARFPNPKQRKYNLQREYQNSAVVVTNVSYVDLHFFTATVLRLSYKNSQK